MVVSILGCGWFGQPLAKSLLSKGIDVKGSTTSPGKLPLLKVSNIPAYLIDISSPETSIFDPSFFTCDILVIANNVRINDEEKYLAKIAFTIDLIKQFKIKKAIFISSISVYGEPGAHVDERTQPTPVTVSGKLLLQAELLLQAQLTFTTTIIRFAGLIGPGRDPGNFFAGKTNIPNGDAPVNLIHLDDCIGITEKIILSDIEIELVNAVAPSHPTKTVFYIAASKKSGLPIPSFISGKTAWKIVDSIYAVKQLKYTFKIEDLLTWVY